jgi:hypothetical protein
MFSRNANGVRAESQLALIRAHAVGVEAKLFIADRIHINSAQDKANGITQSSYLSRSDRATLPRLQSPAPSVMMRPNISLNHRSPSRDRRFFSGSPANQQ